MTLTPNSLEFRALSFWKKGPELFLRLLNLSHYHLIWDVFLKGNIKESVVWQAFSPFFPLLRVSVQQKTVCDLCCNAMRVCEGRSRCCSSAVLCVCVYVLLIRLTFAQQVRAGGVPLARPPLKRAGSPQPASVSRLILRLSTGTNTQTSLKNENTLNYGLPPWNHANVLACLSLSEISHEPLCKFLSKFSEMNHWIHIYSWLTFKVNLTQDGYNSSLSSANTKKAITTLICKIVS